MPSGFAKKIRVPTLRITNNLSAKATAADARATNELNLKLEKTLMLKIKLAVIAAIFGLVGIVYLNANQSISAKGETFEEIAKYKTWTKINKEPIAVEIDESALVGG